MAKTHGMSGTKLHNCWKNMKTRCLNKNSDRYYCYGALGITVCEEWLTFEGFAEWAKSSGYKEGLTIDRKNSSLGYNPSNCRWLTYEDNHKEMMQDSLNCGKGIFSEKSKSKSKSGLRAKLGKAIKAEKDGNTICFNSRGELIEYLSGLLERDKQSIKAHIQQCLKGKSLTCGGWKIYDDTLSN